MQISVFSWENCSINHNKIKLLNRINSQSTLNKCKLNGTKVYSTAITYANVVSIWGISIWFNWFILNGNWAPHLLLALPTLVNYLIFCLLSFPSILSFLLLHLNKRVYHFQSILCKVWVQELYKMKFDLNANIQHKKCWYGVNTIKQNL